MCTHYEPRSVLSVNIHLGGPNLPVSASLSLSSRPESSTSKCAAGLGWAGSLRFGFGSGRVGSGRVGQVVLYIYFISFIFVFLFFYGFLFFITNVAG